MSPNADFDELVRRSNEWLERSRGWRWTAKNIMRGMLHMGRSPHPVYDNPSLTSRQKDAVQIAATVRSLDAQVQEEGAAKGEQYLKELKVAQEHLYDLFKSMF